jgi:hypothetical protein
MKFAFFSKLDPNLRFCSVFTVNLQIAELQTQTNPHALGRLAWKWRVLEFRPYAHQLGVDKWTGSTLRLERPEGFSSLSCIQCLYNYVLPQFYLFKFDY